MAKQPLCPYCGMPIDPKAQACLGHRDLPALDKAQTGWVPRSSFATGSSSK